MGAQFSFGGSPDYYDDNEQLVSSRHSRRSSPTNTGTTMAAAPSKDVYAAMQSPVPHSAIHIDFSNGGSTPKLEGSGYDKVMYDHDLVMIFPYREGGELKKPEKFTADAFVTLMMGKHQERSTDGKMVIDTFQRVLRTTRCYLDDQGHELLTVSDADHSAKAEQRRWHAEEEILKAEYEKAIGSRQMTTESKFCELVATAVARRVQLACGLTTRMFRSCDGDEIIMTLKADDNDLRVEADRTDYPLQVSNKPFDLHVHGEKLENVRREIGDDEMQNSMDHLKKIRGCPDANPDTPEMDPLLMTEQGAEYHPDLHVATKLWGHTEEADGLFVEDHSCRPMKAKGIWGRFYHGLMEVSYDPRTYFAPFADYRIEPMYQPYYRRYPVKWGDKKEETLFLQKDRIRLAASIVHRHINTDALVVAEYLAGKMFALHDEVALNDLRHSWALRWRMMNQPLQKIRYYFGEKVALYFAWLGFYTKMLIFPTIAGIITFIVVETRRKNPDKQANEGANQGFILIAFAVLVVVWSSVFAEIWKRKNHLYNALWGMHGYHRGLQYRAQFRGTKSYNPVTDAEEMTFEDRKKRKRAFYVSILVVLTMIGIVLVALFGLFVLKYYINHCEKDDITCNVEKTYQRPLTLATTAANAIQILLLNMVYRGVAKKLNALENHRTDREYENHLIIKVFLFQFCNSFASFFYIAFLKSTVEGQCLTSKFGPNDCMTELRDQLLILFLIRIVVGNTLEVVIPYLKYRYQLYKERGSMENEGNGSSKKQRHNYIEEQAKLVPYEQEEAFEDYNEMVIQFGFINLFVVAFPLTPLLALCNNMMEVHVDAVKLCFVHRRPFPHAAKSIGAWFYILRFMSYIALATNSALILWTSGLFKTEKVDSIDKSGITFMTKAFIFVVSCQVCIMLSMLIERVVSDVPKQLQLLEKRHDHIVDMVFRNLWSGDDSLLGETSETLDLTIFPNDQWEDRQPLLVAKAVDGGDSSGTN